MPEKIEVLTTSCDPDIEHVIYDCGAVIPYFKDVYLKMVYITKPKAKGKLIGIHACEQDGTLIKDGLIIYLQNGYWKRMEGLNPVRLAFIEKDEKGRIKIGN